MDSRVLARYRKLRPPAASLWAGWGHVPRWRHFVSLVPLPRHVIVSHGAGRRRAAWAAVRMSPNRCGGRASLVKSATQKLALHCFRRASIPVSTERCTRLIEARRGAGRHLSACFRDFHLRQPLQLAFSRVCGLDTHSPTEACRSSLTRSFDRPSSGQLAARQFDCRASIRPASPRRSRSHFLIRVAVIRALHPRTCPSTQPLEAPAQRISCRLVSRTGRGAWRVEVA